jgi:drug/metabolite transporter (DMT)-like permease
MVALSWVAAFVACLGYGVGSVLQSVGARRTAHVAGATGLAMIAVQAPYLAGVASDVIAFTANVVALQNLPLFLVQSIMTASVGVTAVIASLRGERLRLLDWLSLAVLGTGLVLLCITATAENAVQVSVTSQWVILGSAVLPVLVGLVGLRLRAPASALTLAAAAGLGWTGVAVASRALSADRLSWALLAEPLAWAIAVQGLIGAACFALALQRGSVTSVTAVTFVTEMIVPSALGLWLFGDSVGGGYAVWAVLGFVLAVAGTISLSRRAQLETP